MAYEGKSRKRLRKVIADESVLSLKDLISELDDAPGDADAVRLKLLAEGVDQWRRFENLEKDNPHIWRD